MYCEGGGSSTSLGIIPWVIYHTQPLLDKSVSWPSAQEMERNGLGIFFHTLTSRICHLQLGTPFHNSPSVSELESLAASLLLTWKDPLYVRLSRQEILREHNIFFYCKTWENFRPSGILHLEYLLLLHVSSTSPWALTNLRSWPSLLPSVRNQPPEIKIETFRERTNYLYCCHKKMISKGQAYNVSPEDLYSRVILIQKKI